MPCLITVLHSIHSKIKFAVIAFKAIFAENTKRTVFETIINF